MRFDFFVFLLFAIVLARIHAALASRESKLTQSGLQGHSVPVKTVSRRLRANSSDENGDEDRSVSSWLKPLRGRKVEVNNHHVLKPYKIDDQTKVFHNDMIDKDLVKALFNDPKFIFWVDQSLKDRTISSQLERDKGIYFQLQKICTEDRNLASAIKNVAQMITLAEESQPALFHQLEKVQFRVWNKKYDDDFVRQWLLPDKAMPATDSWELAVLRRYAAFQEKLTLKGRLLARWRQYMTRMADST